MTTFLLIVIAIMVLVTMVCSIITTIIEVKDKKANELVKKVLTIAGIALAVLVVIGAAFGVSNIKGGNSSNKTNNSSESDALVEAGFNPVTLDEYLELIESPEKNIILVARPDCSFCEMFTPVLKQASEELDVTVNYINTNKFSQEDWETFMTSLDYLNSEEWGTPLTLVVQNKEVIDVNNGYVELSTIKKFFTDNGFGE